MVVVVVVLVAVILKIRYLVSAGSVLVMKSLLANVVTVVCVLQNALDIRQAVFGGNNLHVAVAHEDLAYASYVQEYSSGRFTDAKYVNFFILLSYDEFFLLANDKG